MPGKSVRSLLAAVLALSLSVVALAVHGQSLSASSQLRSIGSARTQRGGAPGQSVLAEMLERHVNRQHTSPEQNKQLANFSRDTMHYGRTSGSGRSDDSGRNRDTRLLLAPPPFLAVPRTFGTRTPRPVETAAESPIHAFLPNPRSPPRSAL